MKRIIVILLSVTGLLFCSQDENVEIIHQMTVFIFQLGIIIFFSKISGLLFEKFKLPGTLGEITVGILIGPYMLGSVPLTYFGYHHGLFPINYGSIPISTELYGVSIIASILLLFISGLETDIKLLMRYLFSGGMVGTGGVVFSFFPGVLTGMYFLDKPFMSPDCLFLGIISTATSVGITAMILSKNKYMESPEGVTILSAAIIDDVFGIIVLAIVIGIATVLTEGGAINWNQIGYISAKAVVVWLGLTALGLAFSNKLSYFLKRFGNKYVYTAIAFGMSLFLAAVFEKAGLAMIIGAYVMGLCLSKTDISFEIQEAIHPLKEFFVPVFFTVMGMLVNIRSITAGMITFAIVYSVMALLAKVVGCGLPALFTGFNKKGALRIGLGMMPRGEVGLIIAGIGLSNGFISQDIYGVAITMVLLGIITTPPFLSYSLKIHGRGTRKKLTETEMDSYPIDMNNSEQADMLIHSIVDYFDKEGYFITKQILDYDVYHIRKDDIFFKLLKGSKIDNSNRINIISKSENMDFVKELVYEATVKIEFNSQEILKKIDLNEMKKTSHDSDPSQVKINFDISTILDPECVILDLKAKTKEDAIRELVDVLAKNNKITQKETILKEVLTRESIISTGMQNGIAIPHARSEGVESTQLAVGIKRSGIEFGSMDGKPAKIIMLMVSSTKKDDPHIKVLSSISVYFRKVRDIDDFLQIESREEAVEFFRIYSGDSTWYRRVVKKISI
ncbi:MAG TPA: cation:proton antiporter [Clostridiales bacterium]|nr:cation:proton antiporter [Clostridiales bacterium]